MNDRCTTKNCRGEPTVTYLGKPLCERCWEKLCSKEDEVIVVVEIDKGEKENMSKKENIEKKEKAVVKPKKEKKKTESRIPDFQTAMLPLLELCADEKEHSLAESIEYVAKTFKLTQQEREEPMPSGAMPLLDNRVSWARTYLKKYKAVDSPKRGLIKITPLGQALLKDKPTRITVSYLKKLEV